jgi:hypothetical protein
MSSSPVTLKRIHAQRLREVYRSAGWPHQDVVEIDLLAAGLLDRVTTDSGHAVVRLTDAGIQHLASATQGKPLGYLVLILTSADQVGNQQDRTAM